MVLMADPLGVRLLLKPPNATLAFCRSPADDRDFVVCAGGPVSYTHLDVYKRQGLCSECATRPIRTMSLP